jgi:hypothetical protein
MSTQKSITYAGLFALTILGIAIQSLFFIPVITNGHQVFVVENSSEFIFPSDIILIIGIIIFPIIYCSIFSVILEPKTLVNPIWIDTGAIAIVIILTLYNVSYGTIPLKSQAVAVLGFLAFASCALVIVIGLFQWLTVRWVIRINFESADRVSYLIPMKPKQILHKLGNSFLEDWDFSRECDVGDIYVLKREEGYRYLLLEIGANPKDENSSILATVSYETKNNWIVKSDGALRKQKIIIGDIETRLGLTFHDNLSDLDDTVSRLADDNVKELSVSRLAVTWSFMSKMPRTFKVMFGLTFMLLISLSVAHFAISTLGVSSDTYIGLIVALILAMALEIGLPLRDELAKRKREDLDF